MGKLLVGMDEIKEQHVCLQSFSYRHECSRCPVEQNLLIINHCSLRPEQLVSIPDALRCLVYLFKTILVLIAVILWSESSNWRVTMELY